MDIVEGRNTGVPLIISSMQNNGSGLPEFETDEERSYFLVTLPIHPLFIDQKQDTPSTITNERPHSRRSRNDIKLQVLDILKKNGNMSSNEVAIALGYSKLTDTLREVISEMISSGDVTYLYPDKPRSRNQKICLKH